MESVVDIGDITYTLASDDSYLASVGESFEPETVRLLQSLATGTALDVGANIGCTALALANGCGMVHAFEASPSTYDFLRANVIGVPKIIPYNLGLGQKRQKSTLTRLMDNRSGGFVSDKHHPCSGHITENIVITTLDRAVKVHKIGKVDCIKIDVEGFELSVLRGAKRTLRKHRPVVTLEMNHWCLNAFQRTSIPDFMDELRKTFPILYAVHGETYADLHDNDQSHIVMYRHIIQFKYMSIVGAFNHDDLGRFHATYRPGFD